MVEIVGFRRKNGTFVSSSNEQISYDNHIIYLICDEDKDVCGSYCEQIKVKTSELMSVFGTNDLRNFIDKKVTIHYSISNSKVVVSKILLAEA